MKKVLIIEDDKDVQEILAEMLGSNYLPIRASDARAGLTAAAQERPDLIILDVNLPGMDGFATCAKLRSQPSTRTIPILMLSSAAAVENRVRGLDLGADDYLCKPFSTKELLSRVNARLRRTSLEQEASADQCLGNLRLETATHQAYVSGRPVKLTRFEFELVAYFMTNAGKLVDRSRLLSDLWPDSVVTQRTVDTHVANLRRKLRDFDHRFETVYGVGYLLKPASSLSPDTVPTFEGASPDLSAAG